MLGSIPSKIISLLLVPPILATLFLSIAISPPHEGVYHGRIPWLCKVFKRDENLAPGF
jgi:hypothetical protein